MPEAALDTADDPLLEVRTRIGRMEIRGNRVILPEHSPEVIVLAPGPLGLLRVLAKAQGAVLPRHHLLAILPRCGSEHALEMWVSRLRRALPDPGLVQTVVKRGYRLAV